jgi:cytochrome c-type biogenesis protein CcmH/NrfG
MGWFNRGLALMALDRYGEALQSYNRAVNLDPQNADYWTGRGMALMALNDNATSLAAFEQALKLNPSQAQAVMGRNMVAERLKPKPPTSPSK